MNAIYNILRKLKMRSQGTKMNANHNIPSADFIDVKKLMAEYTVEELCETADAYFRAMQTDERKKANLLLKPFISPQEASGLLGRFSTVLAGMEIFPEMTILDFGAGACWTSFFLSEMGLNVISLDVSAAALQMGKEYCDKRRFNKTGRHDFLHFDGRKIDLPDESVDRIHVFDSFHHVPNPGECLKEMSRVLRKGGVIGFCEPGPNHSKSPQSQSEMKNHKVIENDIVLSDIYEMAVAAGFTELNVAIASMFPLITSHTEYLSCELLANTKLTTAFLETVNAQLVNTTIFFLRKGRVEIKDSRNAVGLIAKISSSVNSLSVRQSEDFYIELEVTNISGSTWLPSGGKTAAVNVGGFIFSIADADNRQMIRELRTSLGGENVLSGDRRNVRLLIKGLPKGQYKIEIDIVSELICWFSWNGSEKAIINVNVTD